MQLPHGSTKDIAMSNTDEIYGIHAVRAALQNPKRRCQKLFVTKQSLGDIEKALLTNSNHPKPIVVSRHDIDEKLPEHSVHQGVLGYFTPLQTEKFKSWITSIIEEQRPERCSVVLLDQVTDPHNVGAILRSCSAFSVNALIMHERHSCPISPTLTKIAVGAVEHVPIFYVRNISETLDLLQSLSFMRLGLDENGQDINTFKAQNYDYKAIVMGAEGKGLREKTMKYCDQLLSLPTEGPIQSLNVSVAAGVTLYALLKEPSSA